MAHPGGRPSKYQTAFNKQVYRLALLGASMEEIAAFFEVHIDTLYEWQKVYPKFSEAIKNGRETADAKVADSLYNRAMGYVVTESSIEESEDGIKTKKTKKHIPADTAAAIFWLKNRQRDKWKDKQIVEAVNTNTNINSEPLSVDKIKEIGKALENDY